tara:strand:- start:725 stop:1030 length:306 start_codon:yes stop_codon:yes gene_type:complete
MDIDKVVELIRESRKCPPGHKWDKKRKSCVPKKSSRWKTVYAGWGRYDNEKDDEGKKNGKKNGNGNGSSGNGHSNGGSGNGNGSGSNGGNGNGGSNGGGGE